MRATLTTIQNHLGTRASTSRSICSSPKLPLHIARNPDDRNGSLLDQPLLSERLGLLPVRFQEVATDCLFPRQHLHSLISATDVAAAEGSNFPSKLGKTYAKTASRSATCSNETTRAHGRTDPMDAQS